MKKSPYLLGREPVINLAFKKLTIAVTKNNSQNLSSESVYCPLERTHTPTFSKLPTSI